MKWFTRIALTLFLLIALVYGVLVVAMKITATSGPLNALEQEAILGHSLEPHKIQLIDDGMTSLYERLRLIENAKKSIELEFFIYNIDKSSRLVTQALVKKAQAGVKVRLLVDFSAPVFQFGPAYAKLMRDSGVEVRYYNTTPLYKFFSVQHRSHRKLLIVDGVQALTGGRNIGDEYFDLSSSFNFLDSDILIEGPIVKTMLASFDLYWNSIFSLDPKELGEEISEKQKKIADQYLHGTTEDLKIWAQVLTAGKMRTEGAQKFTCNDITFVTDFPGQGEGKRKIFSTIVSLMKDVKSEVFVESPYFVIRSDGYDTLKSLTDKNVNLTVLTNGLYSTDAYYVISALAPRLHWLMESGISMYVYSGVPLTAADRRTRWGVHAKRAVLDQKTVLLGTYNIDPRSANLNSELMVVCKDSPEFAKAVRDSIQQRMDQSSLLLSEKKLVDESALMRGSTWRQKVQVWLAFPLVAFFDILL